LFDIDIQQAKRRLEKPFLIGDDEELCAFNKRLAKRLTDVITAYGNSYCMDVAWERRRVAKLMTEAIVAMLPRVTSIDDDAEKPGGESARIAGFRLSSE
jgi:hypothetical protein